MKILVLILFATAVGIICQIFFNSPVVEPLSWLSGSLLGFYWERIWAHFIGK